MPDACTIWVSQYLPKPLSDIPKLTLITCVYIYLILLVQPLSADAKQKQPGAVTRLSKVEL